MLELFKGGHCFMCSKQASTVIITPENIEVKDNIRELRSAWSQARTYITGRRELKANVDLQLVCDEHVLYNPEVSLVARLTEETKKQLLLEVTEEKQRLINL